MRGVVSERLPVAVEVGPIQIGDRAVLFRVERAGRAVVAHTVDIGGTRHVRIDLDVVAPGADDRHVGAGDGGDAVVRAAGHLELELVGEGRPVQLVLEVHG